MGAKLTYQDVQSDELVPSKFVSSPNLNVSTGSGAPTFSTQGGSLYVDSTSGTFYINNSGASGTTWVALGNVTTNTENGHYRKTTLTGITNLSATAQAPMVGDLIGIYGPGAWAATGTMTQTRYRSGAAGSQAAGLMAGGLGGVVQGTAELFNGSTWSQTGAMTQTRDGPGGAGSANAAIMAGGSGGGASASVETFNGATWTATGSMNQTRFGPGSAGSASAGLMAGGLGTVVQSTSEVFNGSTWTQSGVMVQSRQHPAGVGSQNAALMAGGGGGAGSSSTELFNGTSWIQSSIMVQSRFRSAGGGSQNAAIVSGSGIGGAANSSSELFNGSTWTASAVMTQSRDASEGAGSQNNNLVAGGSGTAAAAGAEIHTQSTYAKVFARYIRSAKSLGIYLGSNTLLSQGYDTTVTYPANVYLVVNRNLITAVANEVDFSSGFTITSIQGGVGANAWNYNFTVSSLLSVIPGNIIIVSGATTSGNNGTFIVTNVNSASGFLTVINASGAAQGGSAGTIKIISSLLAVSTPSQQDIIIGKTDSSGFITLTKADIASSVLARLR